MSPSVVDPKLFYSDPDPTFQEISDPAPDPIPTPYPTLFLSKEAKAKFFNKTAAQILTIPMSFLF